VNERAHQIALPMAGPVSPDVIHACPDMTAAINLSIQISMRAAKEIYASLGFDKGHWSRIVNGELSYPANKLDVLAEITGNDIPLQWWAHKRGMGLHALESRTERELRESREQAAKLEDENRLLRELLTGRKA